ncbi:MULTISPECIES: CHASE4 domain-containing protein [Cyanophyceae]|uniref:histidine kinase n=1 Tax=Stenomitos frigidus AS-A4 TaxID=2933935 RepID=A0ABV0KRI2_9CYAN|nr:CHASE4 domain-containing protein [Phormidium sp. FACHB-592]
MKLTKPFPFKRLTLRGKTILTFCFILTGLTSVVYFASSAILLGSLRRAEEQSAYQSLQGVLNVLAKDQEAFTSRYSDWSAWDDTYTFIEDRNQAYIKSNLVPEQLKNLKVNLALFVNADGQVVYGTGFDLRTKQVKPLPKGLPPQFAANLLLDYPLTKGPLTGIIQLKEGPMLITCQPILTSAGQGQPRGVLIFGRYINADTSANLTKLTRFPISIQPLNQKNLPADYQQARQALSRQNPIFVHPLSETVLVGYLLLLDVYQQPALILRIELPREIYQQGHRSQQSLMIMILLLGLLFGGVSVLLLERFVLARLTHLSQGVSQIRTKRDLALRLPVTGQDEIANLTQNINEMLKTLEKAQWEVSEALKQITQTNQELCLVVAQLQDEILERQRVESALRQSEEQLRAQTQHLEQTLSALQRAQLQLVQSEKMSSLGQLVAGVAHEINNPVNFIYGNLTYATEYAQQLLQLLALYQHQYPHLTPGLQAALEQIDLEFVAVDLPKALASMRVGAERIRDIIKSLRSFSRLDEAELKTVDLHEGIDSTLLILQSRLKANGNNSGIVVVKNYGQLPPVECFAGQLNQVFMNILTNAIDVIEETRTQRATLKGQGNEALAAQIAACLAATITIQTQSSADGWITIRISDNGLGMPEAVRRQLFDPFFTTKAVGQGTGLGLSISHQIIVEKHQGTLECYSTLGKGTEFIITIPSRLSAKAGKD